MSIGDGFRSLGFCFGVRFLVPGSMLTNMGLMVTEEVRWYVKEASCSEDRSQSILAASSLLNQGRAVAVVMDVAFFLSCSRPPHSWCIGFLASAPKAKMLQSHEGFVLARS